MDGTPEGKSESSNPKFKSCSDYQLNLFQKISG